MKCLNQYVAIQQHIILYLSLKTYNNVIRIKFMRFSISFYFEVKSSFNK